MPAQPSAPTHDTMAHPPPIPLHQALLRQPGQGSSTRARPRQLGCQAA